MNKRLLLSIALVFASFQAQAAEIQAPVATLFSKIQNLGSSAYLVAGNVWKNFTHEPLVAGLANAVNATASSASSALNSAKVAVVGGASTAGTSIAAAPEATIAFVKANPISLTAAAILAVGGYIVYSNFGKKCCKKNK